MNDQNGRELSFEDIVLDLAAMKLQRGGEVVDVEPQVFDLIVFLVRNAGRVVSKDEIMDGVWQGRIVSDSAIATRINAARKALGDDGKTQRFIKTVHGRGFRFEHFALPDPAMDTRSAIPYEKPEQIDIRYCQAPDMVNLAYSSTGNGPPLVKAANFLTHLQHDYDSIIFKHWVQDLSQELRYIRYDERGNGLSDWDITDFSFEKMILDLETVVDAMALERFALLGISQGASISIAYAHRHPDRVSCIVIYGGYAVGWANSDDDEFRKRRTALVDLVPVTWGNPNPVGHQAYSSFFMPDGTPEQHADFNELQRITTTPDNAHKILQTFAEIDVRDLLPDIRVPTLVLHRRDDAVVPFDSGRNIASSIPNARFVPLDGANHIVLEHEAEWPRVLNEITSFVNLHSDST